MSSQIESESSFQRTAVKYRADVRAIARKIVSRCPASVDVEDLSQVGMIALWGATKTFDRARSNAASDLDDAFSAYAMQRVRGAMLDELRSMDILSRRDRSLAKRLRALIERGQERDIDLRRLPSHLVANAASALQISCEEAHRILLHSSGSTSLDPLPDTSDSSDHGANDVASPSSTHDMVEDSADAAIWMSRLPDLAQKLDEREQAVLMNWLHDSRDQSELGKDFNLTESRICQIKKKVLEQLPKHAAAIVRDQAMSSGQYRYTPRDDSRASLRSKRASTTGLEWMGEILVASQSCDVTTIEDVATKALQWNLFTSTDQDFSVGPGTLWG